MCQKTSLTSSNEDAGYLHDTNVKIQEPMPESFWESSTFKIKYSQFCMGGRQLKTRFCDHEKLKDKTGHLKTENLVLDISQRRLSTFSVLSSVPLPFK